MPSVEAHRSVARIALIGDFDASVTAHSAIPLALGRARDDHRLRLAWEWVETASLAGVDVPAALSRFDGVWCVPASPYASTDGALAAITFARRAARPFLGTCGGFQHALLEYARNEWGLTDAAHAELDPEADDPLIESLTCSLVEVRGAIRPVVGSRLAEIYRDTNAPTEAYHCRFGLSARHAHRLRAGPLRIAATDEAGEVRAIELDGHPFFVATLFQPERAALGGGSHPLVASFAHAAGARAGS